MRDDFRGPLRHLAPKRAFYQSCSRAWNYVMAYARQEVEIQSSRTKKTKDTGVSTDLNNNFEELSQFAN